MNEPRTYIKIILNFIATLLLLLGIVLLAPKLLQFFMPFVIGWIIAMIANPLVKWMEKRVKIVRKHSSAIIIIVVLGAVIGLLYISIAAIVRQLLDLFSNLPEIYADLEQQVQKAIDTLNGVYTLLPSGVKDFVDNLLDNMGGYLSGMVSNIGMPSLSSAGIVAKNVAELFFMFMITILSAYFFIAERDNMVKSLKKHIPFALIEKSSMIMEHFKRAIGGYFKAQFKIMLIVTLIIFVGFEILGIQYALLIALLIAFVDLLPIFGTGAILWPWAFIDMVNGNYIPAVGLIIIYIICQIVKQVLQPKMVGDSIGITPLQTLVFMFIGYRFGGILGLILGIPIGMIVISFYRTGMFDHLLKGFKIIIHDLVEYMRF